jgi:hypothetical protein
LRFPQLVLAARQPAGAPDAGLAGRRTKAYLSGMSRAVRLTSAGLRAFLAAGTLLLPLTGCARTVEVVLRQPTAPPSQQALKLAGEGAYHARAGDRQTCLLEFRLPGAAAGVRAFVLYVSAPDRLGTLAVKPEDPQAVRGFLIQEVGQRAGRTDLIAGTVCVRDVWLTPRFRKVDLNMRCEDGTEIEGHALVEGAASEVRAFERQYAADIRLLAPAESQPAGEPGAPAPTARRSTFEP